MSREIEQAVDAMARVQNETYLFQDAMAFIEAGTAPEELPPRTTRMYEWVHPDYPLGDREYREALREVLSKMYDPEEGYPEVPDRGTPLPALGGDADE